jgi:hypothetical protein
MAGFTCAVIFPYYQIKNKMKRIIMMLSAIVLTANAFATEVPKAVKEAFTKKFPAANNIKWDKENAHEYEASFTINGSGFSANFSDTGTWVETESTVDFNRLPEKVQQSFNTAHKGAAIKAAAKIERATGDTMYEVEYKVGNKTKEVLYNEDGAVIKK